MSNTVEEYYDSHCDEWNRLEWHRIEYEMTKRALNEYLEDNSKVLDVGGGPGRYSIYLTGKGHRVTLFDLSQNLLNMAAENARNAGVEIGEIVKGNALELDRLLPDRSYDAVLCMGPMYHLLEEHERKEVVRQCMKLLKPGGVLIAAFISAYAPILDSLKKHPQVIREEKGRLLNYLSDGRNVNDGRFTDAYFINPDNIASLFSEFNIRTLRVMAAEGLGSICESTLMQLPEEDFQEWIDLLYKISGNKAVWGACEHLLYVGRKADEGD